MPFMGLDWSEALEDFRIDASAIPPTRTSDMSAVWSSVAYKDDGDTLSPKSFSSQFLSASTQTAIQANPFREWLSTNDHVRHSQNDASQTTCDQIFNLDSSDLESSETDTECIRESSEESDIQASVVSDYHRQPAQEFINNPTSLHELWMLLSEISFEAARRKWAQEIAKRLATSLSMNQAKPTRQNRMRLGQTPPPRYSPYARSNLSPNGRLTSPMSQFEIDQSFTHYVDLIADATWNNARHHMEDACLRQAGAVEEMSVLYALTTNIVQGLKDCEVNIVNVEMIEDLVRECRAFCRYLSYNEGANQCASLLDQWFG